MTDTDTAHAAMLVAALEEMLNVHEPSDPFKPKQEAAHAKARKILAATPAHIIAYAEVVEATIAETKAEDMFASAFVTEETIKLAKLKRRTKVAALLKAEGKQP